MISPFLAAAREKNPSELFPDTAGTKQKPEGEKSGLFAHLLHRCEHRQEAPLTEDVRKDIHSPAPHAAFTVMIRRMSAAGTEDASAENGGTEAVLSQEETDILSSGEMPGQEFLSPEEELPFPGSLPPEAAPDIESAASASGMMVPGGVSLPETPEEGRGMTASAAEERSRSAHETASSVGLPSGGDVPENAAPAFLEKEASGNPEIKGQGERTAPEKQFSGVLSDEGRLTDILSGKNEPAPGKNADPLRGDRSSGGQENRDLPSPAPADRVHEGTENTADSEGRENGLLFSSSRKNAPHAGASGNGDGEKGEGRQSMSGKNDGTGAALFSQRQAQRMEGAPAERSPIPGGFARELALAGRGAPALEDGMHNVVRFLRAEGLHKATMIVDPPALGRVDIELAATTGGVEASIRVGNEQIRQLVQDQITLLRNHLQQLGVQVAEFTVDIRDGGKEGNGGTRDGTKGRKLRAVTGSAERDEDIPSFAVDLEQGLLHWVA